MSHKRKVLDRNARVKPTPLSAMQWTPYPGEAVAVYLQAFHEMNEGRWPNLSALLQSDPRLALGEKRAQ